MNISQKNIIDMEINEASPKFRDEAIAPMHTAEHLLNATMDKMLGCGRAVSAHVERKKSKCDYIFDTPPSDEALQAVEDAVNAAINADYPVTCEFMARDEAQQYFDLSRLPDAAGETLRIVRIGDYDACPCVGLHVASTGQLGHFSIISHDFTDNKLRLRFKLK